MNTKHLPAPALLIYFVMSFANCFAQTGPAIQWQNTIGGSDDDFLIVTRHTNDGGYIMGGWSQSNISGDKTENCIGLQDYWIVKTDGLGNIQWQNTIGGSGDDELTSIEQTNDGGYILGGFSSSNISGDKIENSIGAHDFWIIKTDSAGNIQWQNTIGGNNKDELHSVKQTTDGGYVLGGISLSDSSGDKIENCIGYEDFWIVKTDNSGNIQWQNTIGGSRHDYFNTVQQTVDGGYVLGGSSDSDSSGDKTENTIYGHDYWLVKTDSTGNIQWQNTIGGINNDYLQSVKQTGDGGYILGGYSNSDSSGDKTENSQGDFDYWIIKTDSVGNIQWQNTIGGNDMDLLFSIQQTNDGNYALGGSSRSNISGDKTENSNGYTDYWIIKTDSFGTILWQNTIGGNSEDGFTSLQQTNDAGFILGGYSISNISGDKTEDNLDIICIPQCTFDYWIIKLAPDTITSTSNRKLQTSNFSLFPNPAKNNITLHLPKGLNNISSITIINALGQIIYTSTVSNTTKQVIIPVSHYPAGMYVAKVVSGDRVYTSKFVVKRN